MAERVQNPADQFSNPTSNSQIQIQTHPFFQSGTYVVQIPKDQVYRVPPPENARIVERLRIPEKSNKRKKRCSPFCCCCSITIAIVILIGLAIAISFLVLKPKDPKFSIQNVLVKQKKKHPTYNITLNVNNPNLKAGIIYKQGGSASLSFRQQKIAAGKYPKFYQERDSSSLIVVVLDGSKFVLPKEIEKSMKSRGVVSLSLNMNVPISLKNGIFGTKNVKLVVACDLTIDKLAKGARITSQTCQTD